MARVLVGIPSGDHIAVKLFLGFTQAVCLEPEEGTVEVSSVTGMNAVSARNKIVKQALDGNFTHLFFMDSDMTFPAGTLPRLLQRNVDIVGGFYTRKKPEFLPNVFELGTVQPDGKIKTEFVTDFKEVEAIGTGCLLINVDVFRKVECPWFEYKWTGTPDGHMMTEDMVFCDKAKLKGYKIWCDGLIRCGHIGNFIVMPHSTDPAVSLEV
jgi:hypothetical protein